MDKIRKTFLRVTKHENNEELQEICRNRLFTQGDANGNTTNNMEKMESCVKTVCTELH